MIELYSIRDVSRILALQESRLRYWTQVGYVGPTVRKGGRFYYTFCDLVAVKAAKDLLEAGVSLQRARKSVEALRKALPETTHPTSKLRICSDGDTIVALADDVAKTLALPRATVVPANDETASPDVAITDSTEANGGTTAYRCFVEACAAEDRGDSTTAEHLFRQALELEPNMAAALTNLGNLVYRAGELVEARSLYERALEHDPHQPEARYNLANVLEDLGEVELAIGELRRVCVAAPEFADAHYNLGIMLAAVGGAAQAKSHLERYLELDGASDWAYHAREFLQRCA